MISATLLACCAQVVQRGVEAGVEQEGFKDVSHLFLQRVFLASSRGYQF